MKMYSKNIVRCISMLEDIYVIVIAVISLMGTVDKVSTTVTYLLLRSPCVELCSWWSHQ